jgi:hypothetical protein
LDVSGPYFRKVGIAPFGQRSFALRHGSCLLPLKLLFDLSRTTPFSAPPALFGSYCASAVITGLFIPAPSNRITQSATFRLPFPLQVATPSGCSGFFSVRSEPLDGGPPHWLTVATIGFHRLCSPHAPKPRTEGRNSASRPVFPTRTTCLVALRVDAARRLVSWSLVRREERPSLRKPVTSACGHSHSK